MKHSSIYGVAAEFDDPTSLVEAARAVRDEGYRKFEVYSPYPIRELDEIVPARDPLPAMVLAGGILGTLTAWVMQYYIAAIDYPTNIGGRPLNSWPAFVPIMFELTVLFASLTAFFGALALCGLPLLHHPMFNLHQFAHASKDRFFLCIEQKDPLFSINRIQELLSRSGPLRIWEIEDE